MQFYVGIQKVAALVCDKRVSPVVKAKLLKIQTTSRLLSSILSRISV